MTEQEFQREIAKVSVPLDEWAENLIDRTFQKHLANCPMRPRVEKMEIHFYALVGYMIGSGLLGGGAGALIAKLIGL